MSEIFNVLLLQNTLRTATPVVLAALGLLRMTEKSRMGADAAIAVVSASSLAAGVVVTSLTTGLTTDVDSFMFGSILALDRADVALSVGVCAAVLVLYALSWRLSVAWYGKAEQ